MELSELPFKQGKAAFLLVQDLKLGGTFQDVSCPLDPSLKGIAVANCSAPLIATQLYLMRPYFPMEITSFDI
jgi:hypothetical protein